MRKWPSFSGHCRDIVKSRWIKHDRFVHFLWQNVNSAVRSDAIWSADREMIIDLSGIATLHVAHKCLKRLKRGVVHSRKSSYTHPKKSRKCGKIHKIK
jgi:hypothetical protein